ncbi:hypothetical protein [Microbulbifer taiwanensis]|uniref:YHS domain-containing protein n=1 Tax=Microbulbifer taiwanensis TaxID=986746 RepID=A0ABW1YK79_9GAMM|nr:hypothetical protein [Microbulbifer taiwanensis]
MKPIFISMVLLLSLAAMSVKGYGHDKALVLEGPYLGQKSPGSIPEVYASATVSTGHRDHSGFFTPEGKYFFFNRNPGRKGTDGDIYWVDAKKIETPRPESRSENMRSPASGEE